MNINITPAMLTSAPETPGRKIEAEREKLPGEKDICREFKSRHHDHTLRFEGSSRDEVFDGQQLYHFTVHKGGVVEISFTVKGNKLSIEGIVTKYEKQMQNCKAQSGK